MSFLFLWRVSNEFVHRCVQCKRKLIINKRNKTASHWCNEAILTTALPFLFIFCGEGCPTWPCLGGGEEGASSWPVLSGWFSVWTDRHTQLKTLPSLALPVRSVKMIHQSMNVKRQYHHTLGVYGRLLCNGRCE